jgi:CspA family cold shock protein
VEHFEHKKYIANTSDAVHNCIQEVTVMQTIQGMVTTFNEYKGFGFIEGPNGRPVFVHYSAIMGDGFKNLSVGETVTYDLVDGPKGPQAINVKRGGQ